jgi:hypothetical protein
MHDLQGDVATLLFGLRIVGMPGTVDGSHAALTDRSEDAVGTELAADLGLGATGGGLAFLACQNDVALLLELVLGDDALFQQTIQSFEFVNPAHLLLPWLGKT